MKAMNWVRWLLAGCVCASVWPTGTARYKFRHPQPPMYKKSWPMGPRISMGNSIHINAGPNGYKQNRPNVHKPISNYNRYPVMPNPARRPAVPMFAVLPAWKTQTILGTLANQGSLPQRGPVGEFHTINKLPEYSPEYRPEQAIPPPTNRREVDDDDDDDDDDKGPIHTIPAPNLTPADKPYNIQAQSYPANAEYASPVQSTVTNYLFGTSGTSIAPQRLTAGPTNPTPTRYYEVTETNEIGPQDYRTGQPNFLVEPEFDGSQNFATTGSQTNDRFANRPSVSNTGLIGTNVQFGTSNAPMQTNLRSSLHVGFPASAIQRAHPTSLADQQTPDLHVGHPAPAGPPLSADQLYDLINSFPQQLNGRYNAGQQEQIVQQQVLQQQLDQLFQQSGNAPQFSQPQMHSFNYDEQSNKLQQQQQQQQIFVGQDYASGRVTADYSLEPETRNVGTRSPDNAVENSDNNVESNEEKSSRQGGSHGGQPTYFTQIGQDGIVSTQFYTTLPSREAAEKLAALAAAGNVNSHLIGQLRKQQANDAAQESSLPPNHKDENYNGRDGDEDEDEDEDEETEAEDPRYRQQTRRYVHRVHQQREKEEQRLQQRPQYQLKTTEDKIPLRIMVPDTDEYTDDFERRNSRSDNEASNGPREDYDYEEVEVNEEPETAERKEDRRLKSGGDEEQRRVKGQHSNSEFGSRLTIDRNN